MKKTPLLLPLLLALATLLTSAAAATAAPQRAEPSFKGMDLYTWKNDQGQWRFALAGGTNRLKTTAEIKSGKSSTIYDNLPALKQALHKLAENEYLSWFHVIPGFEYPPRHIQKEIAKTAKEAKLNLATPLSHAMEQVADATNRLGLDLYHKLDAQDKDHTQNLCLSPFSIQAAFMMTHTGAKGDTLKEMQKTLHLDPRPASIAARYHAYHQDLTKRLTAKPPRHFGGGPTTFHIANRLFGQQGFTFEKPFLATCKKQYLSPLAQLDFVKNTEPSRQHINRWVEKQTKDRIKDLLPDGSISPLTRLVLVNALYLKTPWTHDFLKHNTKDRPFHLPTGKTTDVPMMWQQKKMPYQETETYQAAALTCGGNGDLQLLLILPKKNTTLRALTKTLDHQKLTAFTKMPAAEVQLTLPKFKLTSAPIPLKKHLQSLGMNLAFDRDHADFTGIAQHHGDPQNRLHISDAYHKTFLEIDENGLEAAAATAVVMDAESIPPQPKKIHTLTLDRPFLFAIQDTKTGTCLFLGHLNNPRGM